MQRLQLELDCVSCGHFCVSLDNDPPRRSSHVTRPLFGQIVILKAYPRYSRLLSWTRVEREWKRAKYQVLYEHTGREVGECLCTALDQPRGSH